MTPDYEAYAVQAAALIGLPLHPDRVAAVGANLAQAAAMAALVFAVPLTAADEPAPVFVPAPFIPVSPAAA
ncbi:AtzG-like protein [Humitalea sp. 24SJ18S-53]|uniref:AtzG-like protein n=1 Tax=Humitalea sp. 24SJ18S-53 TaxID=3422307 RepID=UPI003D66CFAF